jgi:hypothetical protein
LATVDLLEGDEKLQGTCATRYYLKRFARPAPIPLSLPARCGEFDLSSS